MAKQYNRHGALGKFDVKIVYIDTHVRNNALMRRKSRYAAGNRRKAAIAAVC